MLRGYSTVAADVKNISLISLLRPPIPSPNRRPPSSPNFLCPASRDCPAAVCRSFSSQERIWQFCHYSNLPAAEVNPAERVVNTGSPGPDLTFQAHLTQEHLAVL